MNSFRRVFLLAIAIALMSMTANAQVFRQRTVVRGGGRNVVRVNAFAVQPFVVQSFQPVFVQPQAIFAAPTSFQAFGGGCSSGFRVQSFSGGCW